jgi:hypothetical protein
MGARIAQFAGVGTAALIATAWAHLSFAAAACEAYVAETDSTVVLVLQEAANGAVVGTLHDAAVSLPVAGSRQGAGLAGSIGAASEALPFAASFEGDRLLLRIGAADAAELVPFRCAAAGVDTDGPDRAAPEAGTRQVFINESPLTATELSRIAQTYGLRIPDGNYWYDPVLGAWGVQGSPTLGFIPPGINWGGPLQAHASGGGTGVFVNGRALHPQDLVALAQLVGSAIAPGRYFITHEGLAGIEGGPPLWNLGTLAATQGEANPTGTWQSRILGSSGFSDGNTGAVFLPNGGIVSYGD